MRKNMRWIAVSLLLCFFPQMALAGNVPYIPLTISAVTPALLSIVESPSVIYTSRLGRSPTALRGDFAENVMRSYFGGGLDFSSNTRWHLLDPGPIQITRGGTMTLLDPSKTGRAGFDGLFAEFDDIGNPRGVMVVESKFGGSPLGNTIYSDRQMSDKWIQDRAKVTATHYERMSNLAQGGRVTQSRTPPPASAKRVTNLPISNKQSVQIWRDPARRSYVYYSDQPIDAEIIAKQLNKVSVYMDGVANGVLEPRRILFHLAVEGNGNINITTQSLDADGYVIKGTKQFITSSPYSQLSMEMKKAVDKSLLKSLEDMYGRMHPNLSSAEIARLAKADWNTAKTRGDKGYAELVKNLNPTSWNWSQTAKFSMISGGIGAGMTLLLQVLPDAIGWVRGGTFDTRKSTQNIGLSFVSAAGGAWMGIASTRWLEKQLLSSSQSRLLGMLPDHLKTGSLPRILGGTFGGLFATAIFAYGYALLNGGDLSDGHSMMAQGIATTAFSAAVSYAIFQTALMVGTASTGTAISTLSGAVATKAALAWLGGGAVSAGGWGVAGGSVVLSGGTVLIVLATGAAVTYGWNMYNESNRIERIDSLLNAYSTRY